MKTRLQLEFLPPTTNHLWRHTGKRVYRTKEYMTWLQAVGWSLNRQAANQPKWNEPVYITAALRRPRLNADLDNRLKGLGDLLQAHGIITNDKLIDGWNVYWSSNLPEGIAVEIAITAANPAAAVSGKAA